VRGGMARSATAVVGGAVVVGGQRCGGLGRRYGFGVCQNFATAVVGAGALTWSWFLVFGKDASSDMVSCVLEWTICSR
jgi:hypothetical protein